MTFILHNITLNSHTSSDILHTIQLIWYILTHQEVDIARIILKNIWDITNPKAKPPLSFPILIMVLCRKYQVEIQTNYHIHINVSLDKDFMFRYCKTTGTSQRTIPSTCCTHYCISESSTRSTRF